MKLTQRKRVLETMVTLNKETRNLIPKKMGCMY